MKKRILSIVLVALMVLSLAACGVSYTSTSTTTETHTDANGNTTTTTTTTTNDNGKTETTTTVEETTADSKIVADLTFSNDAGFDLTGLYFSSSDDDTWSENILEASGYGTLEDGYYVTFEKSFTYSADSVLWDMKIEDADGNYVQFEDIDISVGADPENITLAITYDAVEDSYTVTVE